MDGIGGMIIGHLFKFPDELLAQGYKFTSNDKGVRLLQTIIGLSHKIDNNGWTTTLDAYNMVLNNPQGIKWSSLISKNPTTGTSTLFIPNTALPVSTRDFSKDKIAIAIRFFKGKNYSDIQVAAIVGGLLQESGLNPTLTNSIGAYGIAQWLGPRLNALKRFKSSFNTFQTQLEFVYYELSSSAESRANSLLVKATTLEDAIAAFAAFERYAGINVRDGVTFAEVAVARETGKRIGYTRDIYNRIQAKEF
jgi:hypothetical protein